jgi:hypothetical protein
VRLRPRARLKETSVRIGAASCPRCPQAGDDERPPETVEPLVVLNRAGHWGGPDSLRRQLSSAESASGGEEDPIEPRCRNDGKPCAHVAAGAETGPPPRGSTACAY